MSTAAQGPWEQYASEDHGPREQYAAPAPTPTPEPKPAATPGAALKGPLKATDVDFSKPGAAEAYEQRPNNPFSRYFSDAENLTEEGKKEHPVENVIGTASRGIKGIGNIIATMAPLAMPALGMATGAPTFDSFKLKESPLNAVEPKGLPAGPTITPPPADKSYVRGIPAEPASRGPAGPGRMLPAAPKPPIEVGPAPDASYVRGIPAEVASSGPAGPGRNAVAASKSAPAPETIAGPAMRGATAEVEAPVAGPAKSSKQQVSDLVDRALGVQPLKRDIPLREQLQAAGPVEKSPAANALEAKYPDKTLRRFVHANGEKIVDAVGDDPQTMEAIHGLTRVDLRQALLNAGFDAGQSTVSESKFAGGAAIGRGEAFNTLLKMGYSPKEIVQLAKTP